MSNIRTYQFGSSTLTFEFGDITTSKAQVLVSSDDCYLSMGGGVSKAIRKAGGSVIALDTAKKTPAQVGDVVVTTAGSLPAHYIFHAVTIGPQAEAGLAEEIIRQTTQRCMQLLEALKLNSIAFPAIGAGVAGFTYKDVAVQMAEVITGDLLKRERPIKVTIYLLDSFGRMSQLDFFDFIEEFIKRMGSTRSSEAKPQLRESKGNSAKPEDALAPFSNIKEQRHYMLNQINNLGRERDKLEESLAELQVKGESEKAEEEINRKLLDIQRRRVKCIAELKALPEEGIKVFVSYSHADEMWRAELEKHLKPYRRLGLIRDWNDRQIDAGKEWRGIIDEQLNTAHIILLLVSPDFIASDFINEVELKRAMERHTNGETRVIPIILRFANWQITPLSQLQALPTDANPVTSWPDRDQAFTNITKGIGAVIDELAGNLYPKY